MEPDDRSVDRDADPTRVRPDRQAAHRRREDVPAAVDLPDDELAAYRLPTDVPGAHRMPTVGPDALGAPEDRDAAPTTVRHQFRPAPALDPEAVNTAADHTADDHAADVETGFSHSADLDQWVGPTLPPVSAVQAARDRSDGTGGGEHLANDDLDDAPTMAGSGVPRYPSHRQEHWNPVQEWLAKDANGARAGTVGDPFGLTDDPDGGPTTVLTVAHDVERRFRRPDWAWVEEWRADQSAPAWGPGIAVGIFVALLVAIALVVLTSGVSDVPVLAVVFNLVIAAGMAPALWLCRSLPVLRFLAAGAATGILVGWVAMLITF